MSEWKFCLSDSVFKPLKANVRGRWGASSKPLCTISACIFPYSVRKNNRDHFGERVQAGKLIYDFETCSAFLTVFLSELGFCPHLLVLIKCFYDFLYPPKTKSSLNGQRSIPSCVASQEVPANIKLTLSKLAIRLLFFLPLFLMYVCTHWHIWAPQFSHNSSSYRHTVSSGHSGCS